MFSMCRDTNLSERVTRREKTAQSLSVYFTSGEVNQAFLVVRTEFGLQSKDFKV